MNVDTILEHIKERLAFYNESLVDIDTMVGTGTPVESLRTQWYNKSAVYSELVDLRDFIESDTALDDQEGLPVLCTIHACDHLARWCITGGFYTNPIYCCQSHLYTYIGTHGVYNVESL